MSALAGPLLIAFLFGIVGIGLFSAAAGKLLVGGPSIPVTLSRPRDRRAFNENYEFKQIRNEIVNYLLKARPRDTTGILTKLVLPDIEPEDISGPSGSHRPRSAGPIRRAEIAAVKVETSTNP